jgi:hypothetical protein
MPFIPLFLLPSVLTHPGRQVNGRAPCFEAMILPDLGPFRDPIAFLPIDLTAESRICGDDSSVDSTPNPNVILPRTAVVILTFSHRDTALSVPFLSQNSVLAGSSADDVRSNSFANRARIHERRKFGFADNSNVPTEFNVKSSVAR